MMKFKILVLIISLFKGYPLPLIRTWEQAKPVSLLASWGMGSPLISLKQSSLMVVMGQVLPDLSKNSGRLFKCYMRV
jgi:hypothetical protein